MDVSTDNASKQKDHVTDITTPSLLSEARGSARYVGVEVDNEAETLDERCNVELGQNTDYCCKNYASTLCLLS